MVDVEVAVVVEVHEPGAPAPAAVRHTRLRCDIDERAVVIAVKPVPYHRCREIRGVAENAGDEPIEVTVIVIVTERGAHAGLVDDDANIGGIREGPVPIVQEHL